MIVYQATKSQFLDDCFKNDIQDVISAAYALRKGGRVGKSELASWRESLVCMAKVLNDDSIPSDSGVAIEYGIPQSVKRIDFILTGGGENKESNVIIVELKQWSAAERTEKDAIVRTWLSKGHQEVSHPAYQAWSYAALLNGFNEAVYDSGMSLQPCAYLHNYEQDDVITHSFYKPYLDKAPVFLKGEAERKKLRDFIKRFVKYGDKDGLIYKIENGRVRPSKTLVDSLVGMIKGNQEFVLIDDQKVVYENAIAIAKQASETDKRVLIVKGGPGTGKSVLAINLLVSLSKLGLLCQYVSKNAAPRSVYESKLTGTLRRTQISNMFSGSGKFTETEENAFDVLIVDEAHRLNEKSGLYGNLGENQVKEIISASKCVIFFIDEDQRVTLSDIGTKQEIEKWSAALKAKVAETELASQFRCNGSDGYLAWLDNALQIRPTANEKLGSSEFDFRVVDSPTELLKLIKEKNKVSNKARMVAGYCWPWNSKKNPNQMDVVIPQFKFEMQWNLSSDGSLWIVAPNSVEEIGCIHTSQGLEVDYIGVIVGDDFVIRDGGAITQPEKRAKSDRSIRGYKALSKKDAKGTRSRTDQIIKNTYRTLMTRGMKGCFVYFTDRATAEHFRSCLNSIPANSAMDVATVTSLDVVNQIETPGREPFLRLRSSEVRRYENSIPLIDLKFAAGTFSESQIIDEQVEWVQVDGPYRLEPGLFVAQVIGESMNRRIPNGSWCLFKANPAGTRVGKVVVAQHQSLTDADYSAGFTVKVYDSKKQASNEPWSHTKITLLPDSTDPKYKPIAIEAADAEDFKIVAELIAVLA